MKDPGASRHGNFINYYTFHSAEERAKQLPRGVWRRATSTTSTAHQDRKYIGLDVGCNSGNLTLLLEKFLRGELKDDATEVHLLGIDLDPTLIERAKEGNDSPDFVSFDAADIMNGERRRAAVENYLKKFSRERFDVVFSFSVTMWIHLNHGDQGLVDYLRIVSSMAEMLVIEPQSWKSYRNASRRLRRAGEQDFPLLPSIKMSGDVETHIDRAVLDSCSFRRVAVTDANDWGRKLLIYERI